MITNETLKEKERRFYIEGDIEKAKLCADAEDAQAEAKSLLTRISNYEEEMEQYP